MSSQDPVHQRRSQYKSRSQKIPWAPCEWCYKDFTNIQDLSPIFHLWETLLASAHWQMSRMVHNQLILRWESPLRMPEPSSSHAISMVHLDLFKHLVIPTSTRNPGTSWIKTSHIFFILLFDFYFFNWPPFYTTSSLPLILQSVPFLTFFGI